MLQQLDASTVRTMSEVSSGVSFSPDVMDLLECLCMRAEFTRRGSGRESFHQLNTLTLTRALNWYFVFITFIDERASTLTQMHKNKRSIARSGRSCHTLCVYNYRGSERY